MLLVSPKTNLVHDEVSDVDVLARAMIEMSISMVPLFEFSSWLRNRRSDRKHHRSGILCKLVKSPGVCASTVLIPQRSQD
jgi:hypothetical protein